MNLLVGRAEGDPSEFKGLRKVVHCLTVQRHGGSERRDLADESVVGWKTNDHGHVDGIPSAATMPVTVTL